jgi:excisionase family DNA binding protein
MKGNLNPDFLTVDDAARLVGLTHWTIRRWLQTRRLTRYKSGQHTVVSRLELLALIEPKPEIEAGNVR